MPLSNMKYLSGQELFAAHTPLRILDVRSAAEYSDGHIVGAELLPLSLIRIVAHERLPHKDEPIVLCCATGGRAMLAAKELESLGYTNISVLEGGYGAWCEHSS